MTVTEAARGLQSWLDELLEQPWREMRMFAIQGPMSAGLSMSGVVCTRCTHIGPMTLVAAVRHLQQTEFDREQAHPNDRPEIAYSQLHRAGDLQPTDQVPKYAWSTQRHSCGADVIWADLPSGKRIPIDPAPSADGNVVLSLQDNDGVKPPLAMVLHTESERLTAPVERLYATHLQTCTDPKWRTP